MQKKVSQFVEKVSQLHEVDYGDFKRKVGQYLNELAEHKDLGRDQQRIIMEIRNNVVFVGTGDIETGRKEAISLAEKLK
tara:strand:+ start:634 stop:870 length:237 start_codon:yes stop_codon:yes gene_type:complete